MRNTFQALFGALVALTLAVGPASPANADPVVRTVRDARGDARAWTAQAFGKYGGLDIHSLRYTVVNQRLKVTAQAENLTPDMISNKVYPQFQVYLQAGNGDTKWYLDVSNTNSSVIGLYVGGTWIEGLCGTYVFDTTKDQIRYSMPLRCLRSNPATLRAKAEFTIYNINGITMQGLAWDKTARFGGPVSLR